MNNLWFCKIYYVARRAQELILFTMVFGPYPSKEFAESAAEGVYQRGDIDILFVDYPILEVP